MPKFEMRNQSLIISGALDIDSIETLYKKLDQIKNLPVNEIIFQDINDVHLAAIQLLISFKKSFASKISYKIIDTKFQEILLLTGLNQYLSEES